MPSAPMAWAAVRAFRLAASSTATRISSSVSWDTVPGPGELPPPVAISLMLSAPFFSRSRAARRTSSTPSQVSPMESSSTSPGTKSPWPPVMEMALPLVSSRGPSIIPSLMARFTA